MLRFDFGHDRGLSRSEIERIEDLVNAKILTNAPVTTEVLAVEQAKQRGAMAIFEEKYGDVVRTVTMTDDSVELCGGTHVRLLGDIGMFVILSEGGTAAGVRRIFAATGLNALRFVRTLQRDLAKAAVAAKAQGGDLADKIAKLVARERQMEKRVAQLERQLAEGGGATGGLDAMLGQAEQIEGIQVLGRRVADGTNMAALRELAEKLRDKLGGPAVVLAGCVNDGKAQLALMVSKSVTDRIEAGALIKPIAKRVGGSGGGRPDMAQAGGTEPEHLDEAIASLPAEVRSLMGR